MKRFAIVVAALGILVGGGVARAGSLTYGGYQPWWNIFAHRNHCMTCEEERLQKFWHDYYDALRKYYKGLEHIDWVAYYKNHGYQINAGCGGPGGCCGRINYAPVFVSPMMQWAVPNTCMSGPPTGNMCGPMGCGPGMGGPSMPMSGPGGP